MTTKKDSKALAFQKEKQKEIRKSPSKKSRKKVKK